MLRRGDTILAAKHHDAIAHLWIVLTDPSIDGRVAIVNITDFNNHEDKTVVLKAGDHPFIKKESIVLYLDAQIVRIENLMNAIDSGKGICTQMEACSESVLKLVSNGIFASDHTPNGVIDFCDAHGK